MFRPYAHLFYLPMLVFFRLFAPMLVELRFPLVAAFVLQIASYYGCGSSFMAVNSFGNFLPYYVLGVVCRRNGAAFETFLDWPATGAAAAALFCALFAACVANVWCAIGSFPLVVGPPVPDGRRPPYWFNERNGRGWPYPDAGYYDPEGRAWKFAWYDTLAVIPLRVAMVFAAVRLLSRGGERVVLCGYLNITAFGKRSMANYLMHYYVYFFLALFTPLMKPTHYGLPKIVLVVAVVVLQAHVWMSPWGARVARPLFVAPDIAWLLVPPD